MTKPKHMPWFRLYHEAIDDPKLKLLTFEQRWHYVALLCCKAQGILDTQNNQLRRRMVAAKMELSTDQLEDVIHSLADLELIDADSLEPLAWDSRQFKSDDSTERVKQYRERQKKQQDKDVKRYSNGHVTVQETDTDKDKDKDIKTPMSSCKQPDGLVFDYWRQVMGHPRAKLDDKRKRKIRARLKDGYTIEDLKAAIDGCKRSPHHMGQNDRGTVYDDIELICRDAPHVDRFINLAHNPDMAQLSGAGRRTALVAEEWLNER